MRAILAEFMRLGDQGFATESRPGGGGKWKALSPRYKAWKAARSRGLT